MKNKLITGIIGTLFLGLAGLAFAGEGAILKTYMDSVEVYKIVKVHAPQDIRQALEEAKSKGLKIAIAGARHAEGGQQWYHNGIVLDMLGFDKIISLDKKNKIIRVQSGVTWKQIQDYLRPYGYAVRVMQDTNFLTVGGSLGSNIHGEDPNYGSIIETVQSFRLMQADGKVINVSRSENPELFSLVIGGYGLFGVILDIDFLLTDNVVYKEDSVLMNYKEYPEFIRSKVLNNAQIGGQNAVFPWANQGDFETLKVTTYSRVQGDDKVSAEGYIARDDRFALKFPQYKGPARIIVEEYFIPVDRIIFFMGGLKEILKSEQRVSAKPYLIRYAKQDKESFLPYAKGDSFSVSIAIDNEQPLSSQRRKHIQNLTRQVVGLSLNCGGVFYLTKIESYPDKGQLFRAYPEFSDFMEKKKKYDPQEIFMNEFYEYYSKHI